MILGFSTYKNAFERGDVSNQERKTSSKMRCTKETSPN